jgi:hypothetical protein
MNINNASSTNSSGNASIAAGAADRSSASASVSKKNTATSAAKSPPQPSTSVDRVTISQEAQNKLKAETAKDAALATKSGGAASPEAPSDAKKFTYGALGLERPTTAPEAPPEDSYSYGRWASAAVTTAAVLSALI